MSSAYQAYLERFDRVLGQAEIGSYRKHQGVLVKKLSAEEFAAREPELTKLKAELQASADRGHTINSTLLRTLRERAAELIIDLTE